MRRHARPVLVFAAIALAVLLIGGVWTLSREAPIVDDHARRDAAMPPYQHIFVIVVENRSSRTMMRHSDWTPNIQRLAAEYGTASDFYSEVHPSLGNYVAMIGGDTFGIHDDDAYFCHPNDKDPACPNSDQKGYVSHEVTAPSLADQITAAGLSWKGYMEDIPADRPLAAFWPTPDHASPGRPADLYASKHNAFVHFRNVNRQPPQFLAEHFGGFDQLAADLASNRMPNYAHIIPNQCHDMHGLSGPNVPADCQTDEGLVRRGDAEVGRLVALITGSTLWNQPANAAVVLTFDESDGGALNFGRQYCCGSDPDSDANFGGGHIMTVVITNHGPRHFTDATPYNHYSLLRTTEVAFGIRKYLRHAAETDKGVRTMTPLFAVRR